MIHRVNDDLREVNGRPLWLWKLVWRGTNRFEQLLAAYSELQHKYSEEEEE